MHVVWMYIVWMYIVWMYVVWMYVVFPAASSSPAPAGFFHERTWARVGQGLLGTGVPFGGVLCLIGFS